MKKRLAVLVLSVVLLLGASSAAAVTIKKGSQGLDPLFLNMRLAQLGYGTAAAMSSYTAETAEAVKDFQEKNGIKATGAVKDDTWAALFHETFTVGIDCLPEEKWNSRGYYVSGSLVPPFSKVEVPDNSSGYKSHAVMDVEGYQLHVYLSIFDSMDDYITPAKANDKAGYDETFVKNYGASGYKVSGEQDIKINGKPAHIWSETFKYTIDGTKSNYYCFRGIVELDRVYGHQVYGSAVLSYPVPASAAAALSKAMGMNEVKAALAGLRCGRDRKTDYQAGAAQRRKASKVKEKITLPDDFQPVEEAEQTTLEMIYDMWEHVNPDADGAYRAAFDADSLVNMYYGAKLMQKYMRYVDNGSSPDDAATLMLLSVANGAFDSRFKEKIEDIQNSVSAVLLCAANALAPEAEPYLTFMGIEKPRWIEEDLARVYDTIIPALARMQK